MFIYIVTMYYEILKRNKLTFLVTMELTVDLHFFRLKPLKMLKISTDKRNIMLTVRILQETGKAENIETATEIGRTEQKPLTTTLIITLGRVSIVL